MSELIKLEVLDRDGAVAEALDGLDGADTRGTFLRKAGLAGAGIVSGGVFFGGLTGVASAGSSTTISTRRKSAANDVRILNYALTLEFLEAEFYRQALAGGALRDAAVLSFARTAGAHERTHVATLRGILRRAAVRSPRFDFGEAVTNEATFKATAQAVEDLGVSAYAGQGPNISQRAVVQAALSIHSVEARHAAWIRFINSGGSADASGPAPAAFDRARSQRVVLAAVGETGFIQS